MGQDTDTNELDNKIKKLDLINENLTWFSKYKVKINIRIGKENHLWFESIIGDEDFKQQIITKYRNLKLMRILKNKNINNE